MEVTAKAKYIRISPRKARSVADVIRGLSLDEAYDQLRSMNKRAVKALIKLIDSGAANAENNFELKRDNLYIKAIAVDEGPTLKRWQPRARGRATPIRKRTSHISLVLSELVSSGQTGPKKQTIEKPVRLGEKPKQAEGVKTGKSDEVEADRADKTGEQKEAPKKIVDQRSEGKGKHAKIEGKDKKGFGGRIFRRKSG